MVLKYFQHHDENIIIVNRLSYLTNNFQHDAQKFSASLNVSHYLSMELFGHN